MNWTIQLNNTNLSAWWVVFACDFLMDSAIVHQEKISMTTNSGHIICMALEGEMIDIETLSIATQMRNIHVSDILGAIGSPT